MTTRGPCLKKLKAAVDDADSKELRAESKFDEVQEEFHCALRLHKYKLKRFFKAMDKCVDLSAHGPLKVQLRETKWQGEVDKFNNAAIEMKNAAIATEKARVAHMAAIIAELAPGYVYDTVYDVLVPV